MTACGMICVNARYRKLKLPSQQNGQVYLTSHRLCYVDKDEPRKNSVALNLKDVDRYEFYAGFLKSSPKITMIPKPFKRSALHNRVVSNAESPTRSGSPSPALVDGAFRPPPEQSTATWVCIICSFSNPVPSNFDPMAANAHTPLPPCLACGIKPTLSHVLKAAISNASSRPSPLSTINQAPGYSALSKGVPALQIENSQFPRPSENLRNEASNQTGSASTFPCPRCTFSNHPSMLSCEMCGAPLHSQSGSPSMTHNPVPDSTSMQTAVPVKDTTPGKLGQNSVEISDNIKISFRGGGEKIFYERLKGSMTQRKWLLHNAPPAPKTHRQLDNGPSGGAETTTTRARAKTAGIAGLEQRGLNMRKNNEILIGSAFEDLEALMASAKEVIALAERFARQNNGGSGGASSEDNALLAESASQLGLITTKDIVGGGGSESLYLSELSRNLAEFLTDDSRGVLKRAGGILTLVDLWAMFNRARGGVELVSPLDFEKAARLWESLKLPVRLRTFRSGVMVVQSRDRTDDITIKSLLTWLQDLHEFPPEFNVPWDWREFGQGVTAQEAAERFGWSLGVAEEELLMAEEQGALCREEGLEGLKFWENHIGSASPRTREDKGETDDIVKRLIESGLM